MIMGLDRTYHARQFFLLYLLFISYSRLSWLSVSFLLHVKYTVSYRTYALTDYSNLFTHDFVELFAENNFHCKNLLRCK